MIGGQLQWRQRLVRLWPQHTAKQIHFLIGCPCNLTEKQMILKISQTVGSERKKLMGALTHRGRDLVVWSEIKLFSHAQCKVPSVITLP